MLRTFLLTTALCATTATARAQDAGAVLATYADIGAAVFEDGLISARTLRDAVDALVAAPSPETLHAARQAWLAARVVYPQTEVFRFGNPLVDAWEGGVNAWPLDEGLIDYVADSYGGPTDENLLAAANIIANPELTVGGIEIDATTITPAFLRETLNEADGVETNVATGYHAIEFLLWGQDLNGHGAGAGDRPWTDFATDADCTNGHCDRRGQYLVAATDLLVSDFEWIAAQWAEGGTSRRLLLADERTGVAAILTGLGSLSYGELAGERMRLGLLLNDPEEEQDCFSDNTHNSHYYDGIGMRNVYLGSYTRIDGTVVDGPALADLVAATDAALDAEMRARLTDTLDALARIKAAGDTGMAYDQMLARDNAEGGALIQAGIDALIAQTRTIERITAALGVEGLSIDAPGAVGPSAAE